MATRSSEPSEPSFAETLLLQAEESVRAGEVLAPAALTRLAQAVALDLLRSNRPNTRLQAIKMIRELGAEAEQNGTSRSSALEELREAAAGAPLEE